MNDFFKNVKYLESIDSTNSYLKKGEFEDKTIVYTFNQTKGRGRDQKPWIDFKDKNIAISFLIKPKKIFNNNIWYIAASSLALIDIIEKNNIKNSWIKWPNDIYIKNDKLAGILAESIWHADRIKKLIIGIGININCSIDDLACLENRATSFFVQKGIIFDMHEFFYVYKDQLSKWLLLLEKDEILAIREKWLEYCKIIDKKVVWINQGNKIIGKIIKIEKDGGIILKTRDGYHKITSGEIKEKD